MKAAISVGPQESASVNYRSQIISYLREVLHLNVIVMLTQNVAQSRHAQVASSVKYSG